LHQTDEARVDDNNSWFCSDITQEAMHTSKVNVTSLLISITMALHSIDNY
jgi:hypothetical protein